MILCPSIMCVDFTKLNEEIKELDEAGIDIFHLDIMDGNFVPNMTLGINDIKAIKKLTNKTIDVHLMIDNPVDKVDWFINAGADIIYLHSESADNLNTAFNYIKNKNVNTGLAINPETQISDILKYLPICDYLLVMSVHPGFAGQKYIEDVNPKIEELIKLKKNYNYKIIIDGACSKQVITNLSSLGCDGFILGTSALFGKEKNYKQIINELRMGL